MPTTDLAERYAELQTKRRELEVELAEIDGKIREAINNGDLVSLDRLSKRKDELPKQFISASTAESTMRNKILNAEDEANMKILEAAEAERDELKTALEKRQKEVEAEFAEMKNRIEEAESKVSSAYSAIEGSRNLGAAGDAGFKKSLAALGI